MSLCKAVNDERAKIPKQNKKENAPNLRKGQTANGCLVFFFPALIKRTQP